MRRIRKKLGLDRHEFADTFGLSGYKTVSNIEFDLRRPSQLTIILLRLFDQVSLRRAKWIMSLMRKYGHDS